LDELLGLLNAVESDLDTPCGPGLALAVQGHAGMVAVSPRCPRATAGEIRQLWLSNRATNMALSWARALETDTATRLHLPFSSRSMAIPSLALRLSALEK